MFYNDFVDQGMSYTAARALTEDYFQEIVLTDVLPAYVGNREIGRYLHARTVNGQTVYTLSTPNFPDASFTPVEFSDGAYRFGHALVREMYHINDILPDTLDVDDNVDIFNLDAFGQGDLTGGGQLPGPEPSSTACALSSLAVCGVGDPAGHQITWRYFVPALSAEQAADGLPIDEASMSCTGATGVGDRPGPEAAGIRASTTPAPPRRRSRRRCSTCRRSRSPAAPTPPALCATGRATSSPGTSRVARSTGWPPARRSLRRCAAR